MNNDKILEPELFGGEVATEEMKQAFEADQGLRVVRGADGSVVIVDSLGNNVGTLKKAKKMSYESGLQNHFQKKRLEKIQAKNAAKQAV